MTRSARPQRALARRNYVLREMAKNGYITEEQRAEAAATPLGTIRYGSNAKFREKGGYFMEEVRRDLMKRFGEDAEDGPNSVYAGGLWVRTSMVPKMQDAAAEALREGLAKFDGGRGWRDTELSIDVDGDWQTQLRWPRSAPAFPDWKKAVVLSTNPAAARGSASATGRPARLPRRPRRSRSAAAAARPSTSFRPGMIIIVKQMGPDSYALRSIPEVGGGFVAEEVRTGRVMAMQGGFDVIGSSYNRATQAQRQPGSAFKPIVYVDRARKRHDARRRSSSMRHFASGRARASATNASATSTANMPAPRRCAGASSNRAT